MTSDSLRGNIQATIDRLVGLQQKVNEAAAARPDDDMAQMVAETWDADYELVIATLRDILEPGSDLPEPAYFHNEPGSAAPLTTPGVAERS